MPPFTFNSCQNGNFFGSFHFGFSSCRHFVDSLIVQSPLKGTEQLKCYAVLEDGDLPGRAVFALGGLAGGDLQHEVQEPVPRRVQILALGNGSGVEVDPVALLLEEGGVGGDLHRGGPGRRRAFPVRW